MEFPQMSFANWWRAMPGVQSNDLGLGAAQEKKRLKRLLVEWLEIEKLRDPFTLRETEDK